MRGIEYGFEPGQERPTWARLEPVRDTDGSVYASRLVIEFDPDWQDFALVNKDGGLLSFSLHLSADMAEDLPRMLAR